MHAKVQHYVPQCYLRNFSTKARKGYLVGCFDKSSRKSFRANIKNVASQTKFYDFTDSHGNEVSFEEAFSDLETAAAQALKVVIDNPKMTTLLPYKEIFAEFFAVQDCRTPAFRDAQNDTIKVANRKLARHGLSFPEETEDQEKEYQVRFLIETSANFANVLLNMKWILLANKTSQPFWTSDNPIVKYNPLKDDMRSNLGLMCEGIQLYIPISPYLAIVICDPFGYAHSPDEINTTDLDNINLNNSGQLAQSKQYVFSVDNNFQIAQKWIDENPSAYDPNRPRVIDGSESMLQNYKNRNSE